MKRFFKFIADMIRSNTGVSHKRGIAAFFALGLSFGKEFGDIPTSGWSWGDLVADGLGILIGYTFLTITIWLVNANFHIA